MDDSRMGEPAPARRRWPRRLAAGATGLVVLGAATAGGFAWGRGGRGSKDAAPLPPTVPAVAASTSDPLADCEAALAGIREIDDAVGKTLDTFIATTGRISPPPTLPGFSVPTPSRITAARTALGSFTALEVELQDIETPAELELTRDLLDEALGHLEKSFEILIQDESRGALGQTEAGLTELSLGLDLQKASAQHRACN
jgi:hypothetical protein